MSQESPPANLLFTQPQCSSCEFGYEHENT